MNRVVRGLMLLACAAVCASRFIDGHCRCVTTASSVNPKLILAVKSYDPRPYCNKKEVIVTLKDQTEVCLDPDGKFTRAVLATLKKQKELLAARNKSTTTTATTAAATATTATTTTATTATTTTRTTSGSTSTPTPSTTTRSS